jgi:inosose dehydratase
MSDGAVHEQEKRWVSVSGIRLANAPTSWGIEKPSDPAYPSWERVLEEMAEAGYEGTELGPYGFFPSEPEALSEALSARGLSLVGGSVMRPFHVASERSSIVELARRTVTLLSSQGARFLVLIVDWTPDRVATAGRSDVAPRLDDAGMRELARTVTEVGHVAREAGVVPVLHAHAGTYCEFPDELDRVRSALEPGLVKVCVDTGHAVYGGFDPVSLLEELGDDLAYVHLKDVNPAVLDEVRSKGLSFWEAYSAGIFCPLGQGVNDFKAIREVLAEVGYTGWATVEQDADPSGSSDPLRDARASRAHLVSCGWVEA